MKTLFTLALSILLLISTALIAETPAVEGYDFNSYNSLNFYNQTYFPSRVEHTFHSDLDKGFEVYFHLDQGSSMELDKAAFTAQNVLTLNRANCTSSSFSNLDEDLVVQNPKADNYYYQGADYNYHFTPSAVGTGDIVFKITDQDGKVKSVKLSITVLP